MVCTEMNFILSKKENYLACVELIAKCWEARKSQLYTVEIKRWSKKRSVAQNAMYWAMITELAIIITEQQGINYHGVWVDMKGRTSKEDLHHLYSDLCPYIGMTSYIGLDGKERVRTRSLTALDMHEMAQAIEYLFKFASDCDIQLTTYEDHNTAQGKDV